jgi:hypothetical protein
VILDLTSHQPGDHVCGPNISFVSLFLFLLSYSYPLLHAQVNIPAEVYAELTQATEQQRFTRHMFNRAQNEIFRLVEKVKDLKQSCCEKTPMGLWIGLSTQVLHLNASFFCSDACPATGLLPAIPVDTPGKDPPHQVPGAFLERRETTLLLSQ